MDRLERYRSNSLGKRLIAHPRCNKILSTGPSTVGNRQTRTAVHARGEKGGLPENIVLNRLHGVQFAIHANAKIKRLVNEIKGAHPSWSFDRCWGEARSEEPDLFESD
jgi:acyl-CoA reductase-like NAD-dependent aldehyde dehydrogenase